MGETHGENLPRGGRGSAGGPIGSPRQAKSSDRSAIGRLREAAKAHPEDAVAWYNLGDALLAEGNAKDALAPLRKAVDLAPSVDLFRYDLALALLATGKGQEGANHLADIVKVDPGLQKAQSHLGIAAATNLALHLGEQGEWKEAIRRLAPAASIACGILYNLGRFHLRAGDFEQARGFLVAAAAIDTESEDVLHLAGAALMNLGEWQEAERHLERATTLKPPCANAWYDRGVNLARRKDPGLRPRARGCFEEALRIDPAHSWAHYDIACLEALDGRIDAAFEGLERAVRCGLSDAAHVEADDDLATLRRDARWKGLLRKLRTR